MTSLLSPEEGQLPQSHTLSAPVVAADTVEHRRSTRPFSASDTRNGDLLTIVVHFGRHLDSLVPQTVSRESNGVNALGVEQLNTYVVAAVGAFATSPDVIHCRRGGGVRPENCSVSPHLEDRVFYEQSCSPYAVTRVVEGSNSPAWNEVLAVPLPAGWCADLPRSHEQPDQLDSPAPSSQKYLALKLELVERGASHQEDFLLATCVLPLNKSKCHLQQTRFAFSFSDANSDQKSQAVCQACIFVSLHASSLNPASSSSSAAEHVEITVESFTPIVVTGNENEEVPVNYKRIAALIKLHVDDRADPAFVSPGDKLEGQFQLFHDGQALSEHSPVAFMPGSLKQNQLSGLTPTSSTTTGSASGVYEWNFPLMFSLVSSNSSCTHVCAVDIALFVASSVPHKLVGCGQLELTSDVAQVIQKDGSPVRHTVIPIMQSGNTSHTLGHIALRLRWWNVTTWNAFIAGIPSRRVICTNRKKRSPQPALAWMGAILRGLNRHPVTSFCDAGGVSTVLAELFAEPINGTTQQHLHQQGHHEHQQKTTIQPNENIQTSGDCALLREHLARLQAEGDTQRHQIERLQYELDTRLVAIKTCGLEIVALRRQARQKDGHLQELKEQVEATQRREQQQLTELIKTTGSTVVSRPDYLAASQRFTLLVSKYKELDREYRTAQQQLADAHRSLTSYDELESRHAKLQEAHIVQASLVQRLQRDKHHMIALKKAVRVQEKVIRQFEQAVAQQSAVDPEKSLPEQHASKTERHELVDGDSSGAETREALLRVRVGVLEQQLQTNAREAAIEINTLRMRILELEAAECRQTGK